MLTLHRDEESKFRAICRKSIGLVNRIHDYNPGSVITCSCDVIRVSLLENLVLGFFSFSFRTMHAH